MKSRMRLVRKSVLVPGCAGSSPGSSGMLRGAIDDEEDRHGLGRLVEERLGQGDREDGDADGAQADGEPGPDLVPG